MTFRSGDRVQWTHIPKYAVGDPRPMTGTISSLHDYGKNPWAGVISDSQEKKWRGCFVVELNRLTKAEEEKMTDPEALIQAHKEVDATMTARAVTMDDIRAMQQRYYERVRGVRTVDVSEFLLTDGRWFAMLSINGEEADYAFRDTQDEIDDWCIDVYLRARA